MLLNLRPQMREKLENLTGRQWREWKRMRSKLDRVGFGLEKSRDTATGDGVFTDWRVMKLV